MVKRYLDLKTLDDARRILGEEFELKSRVKKVPVTDSLGRVTAGPIFSRYSIPMTHLSAMDGIAVKTADTHGASEQRPVKITDAVRINTGNMVPRDYDAVIMIEDVREEEDGYVIRRAAAKWQNIRPTGEDIGESEMILPSLHRIRPSDIGALIAYGLEEIDTVEVRGGIIPTGSELTGCGEPLKAGCAIESNSHMAAAMLGEAGADYKRYGIVADVMDDIIGAIETGIRENDFLLVSAGSSAGTKDFTADAIMELGELLVHGITIRPAKPVIIGKIEGKPVIGLPGYPLAAWTIMREIVWPLLENYGLHPPEAAVLDAEVAQAIDSPAGLEEFVLVSAADMGKRYVAVPHSRGAGVQMSAVRANAYLRIPAGSEGLETGEKTEIKLLADKKLVDNAFLVTGSHDPCLDYIADMAALRGTNIYSCHVGSMGGILALKRHMCHAAPTHLLSPDGDYNTEYLKKYIPGEELALLCVADRQQGIASMDGITFEELEEHTYVNRQRGSGTRVLLDYELGLKGMDSSKIKGYEREMNTHLDVALAIKNGDADAGMCTLSAANIHGLKFVPVATEKYELAMFAKTLEDERAEIVCDCIRSQVFKDILEGIGGYVTENTGSLRFV